MHFRLIYDETLSFAAILEIISKLSKMPPMMIDCQSKKFEKSVSRCVEKMTSQKHVLLKKASPGATSTRGQNDNLFSHITSNSDMRILSTQKSNKTVPSSITERDTRKKIHTQ